MDAAGPYRLAVAGDQLLCVPLPHLWLSIPPLYTTSPLSRNMHGQAAHRAQGC